MSMMPRHIPLGPSSCGSAGSPRAQRGVALVVALILLVVITLVGLAAIGTTILQNRATANQYDRQISFQNAEAAMRVATAELVADPNTALISTRLCGHDAVSADCEANPFVDTNLPNGSIHTVATGNAVTQFTAGANAPMQPQYVIEDLGDDWPNPSDDVGASNTANCANYGTCNLSKNVRYLRITARSCDPTDARCDNRAVVTLQSIVKQG